MIKIIKFHNKNLDKLYIYIYIFGAIVSKCFLNSGIGYQGLVSLFNDIVGYLMPNLSL